MHEDELRAMVRDAVARHLGSDGRGSSLSCPVSPFAAPTVAQPAPASWTSHLSHGRFVFLAPTDPDAPCVVEPQVRCHHCGFCQSYGN
jgi:hypothetical protein